MKTDIEYYKTVIRLAYRRAINTYGCAYSLQDVYMVFLYYFETYEMIIGKAHPDITVNQVYDILLKISICGETDEAADIEIFANEYPNLIDQHFATKYRDCDYNIIHFFSGKIRYYRYMETEGAVI